VCVLDLRRQPVDPETVGRREQPARGLLDPVAQRLRLPFGVPEFIERIVSGTTNEVGRRTLMMLITTWDMAGGGPFAASSIATVGLSKTVDTVQELFMGPVFDPLLKRLGADSVKFRASLCASQLIGLGILRYAVRSEPIASMKAEALADAMAPTLQRYLIGNIS
jgi:Tetracyclin repressor-like, C-terminal domain